MNKLATTAAALFLTASATFAQNDVGPGIKTPAMSSVGAIFAEACVKVYPTYSRSADVLRASGFVRNTRTGTLNHPGLQLSVRVAPAHGCSVVAGTSKDDAVAKLEFRTEVDARATETDADVVIAVRHFAGDKPFVARINPE